MEGVAVGGAYGSGTRKKYPRRKPTKIISGNIVIIKHNLLLFYYHKFCAFPSSHQWNEEIVWLHAPERKRSRATEKAFAKLFKNVWFNFLSGKPSPWSPFVRFELFFRFFWVFFLCWWPATMQHVTYARATLRKYYYFAGKIHRIQWKLTRPTFGGTCCNFHIRASRLQL